MSRHIETSEPFRRELPGGGYVAIEVTAKKSLWRNTEYEGRVVIERRASWRRAGHTPPVIATASGESVEAVVRQLLPAAQCNSTIGLALLTLTPA
jgi:hypothetical protein